MTRHQALALLGLTYADLATIRRGVLRAIEQANLDLTGEWQ